MFMEIHHRGEVSFSGVNVGVMPAGTVSVVIKYILQEKSRFKTDNHNYFGDKWTIYQLYELCSIAGRVKQRYNEARINHRTKNIPAGPEQPAGEKEENYEYDSL